MTVLRWGICEKRINNFHHFCLILWTEQLIKKWSTVQSTAVIIICCSRILMLELLRDTVCVYVSLRVVSMVLSAHLSTAGNLHAVDGSGNLDGAHAAVLAALFPDVLQDLLVVLVVHQLLRHHHVEQAQHLRGHARVLQPLQPRHLQRHRRLYDGGLQEDGGVRGGHTKQLQICFRQSRFTASERFLSLPLTSAADEHVAGNLSADLSLPPSATQSGSFRPHSIPHRNARYMTW